MNYGVPYMGSKNRIAVEIVNELPAADTFVDLFAGGCAVTHAAMLSGKYKHFIANDIDGAGVDLFVNAINGKYKDEKRWISREDFKLFKDTDPYIKYCWSFGNKGDEYLYAPEIERFKKWLHYMFFAETPKEARLYWKKFIHEFQLVKDKIATLTAEVEQLCKECSVEPLRNPDGTVDAKKIKKDVLTVLSADIRKYMRDALKGSGHTAADIDRLFGTNGMASHYFSKSQWELPTEEAYEKMKTIIPGLTIPWATLKERLDSLQSLQSLQSLDSLESLERLERLQSLESLQSLQSYKLDYQDVEIQDGAVIYCDIPYKDKTGYRGVDFDYDRFYKWALKQKNIFISEYDMPPEFECIWQKTKTSKLSTAKPTTATEKLFIPKGQGNVKKSQISLIN